MHKPRGGFGWQVWSVALSLESFACCLESRRASLRLGSGRRLEWLAEPPRHHPPPAHLLVLLEELAELEPLPEGERAAAVDRRTAMAPADATLNMSVANSSSGGACSLK